MAIALATPLLIGLVIDGFAASSGAGLAAGFARQGRFVSMSTVEPAEGGDAFVADEVLRKVGDLDGVAEIRRGERVITQTIDGTTLVVAAEVGEDWSDAMVSGRAPTGALAAGDALISPALSRELGLREGGSLQLATPDGPESLHVRGVAELDGMSARVAPRQLDALYGPLPATYLQVVPREGVTEEELAGEIKAVARPVEPELKVRTSDEIRAEVADGVSTKLDVFRVLRDALVLASLVTVASTLTLTAIQHRRDVAVLVALGAPRATLWRVGAVDSAISAAVAVILALALAPLILWALITVTPTLAGLNLPYVLPWSGAVIGAVVVFLISLVGGSLPAWQSMRAATSEGLVRP